MFKKFINTLAFLLAISITPAQVDSYYQSISPASSSFITDLESRVRSPYTRISYDVFDETYVANFAARDTTGGQKVVTCVYSGYNYVYTEPFKWYTVGEFSREHTWCKSWMPIGSTSSYDQYQDQHHLFPVEQAHANGVRNNHPLGNVVTPTSTFHTAKYGKNSADQNVYEPRDKHKGDAARALLYMCIRYDGIGGYTWNFDWLNNTKLPSLSEAPQDLNTLLQWHKQDPPDKWEVDRNNYIESIQQNRNPFVDHPEFVNYIDFNNLTKQSPVYSTEPDNYPTSISSHKTTAINVTWHDATGTNLPSGYLLIAYESDNYYIPIDGEVYSDDSDLSDGVARINIEYSAANSYDFTGGDLSKTYYFRMYSYSGNGTSRNYKINGTVPSTNTTVPLPVELNMFNGFYLDGNAKLVWSTATEINNYGFEVQQKTNGAWNKIGFVPGHGNSNSPKQYSFIIDNVLFGSSFFRLKQIDFDGKYEFSKEVEIKIEATSKNILLQNFPNPFNPSTIIGYQLAGLSTTNHVTLKVYDMLGREIAKLIDEQQPPGKYSYEFTSANYNLPSGTYIYQLCISGTIQSKKMLIIK